MSATARRSSWAALLVSFAIATAASAQCSTTCPPGSIQQNDGCWSAWPGADPNGACLPFGTPQFQPIGAVAFGAPRTVCGSIGRKASNASDYDSYSFTLANAARLKVTGSQKKPGGMASATFECDLYTGESCADADLVASTAGCPFDSGELILSAGVHTLLLRDEDPGTTSCSAGGVSYVATITVLEEYPACGEGDCASAHAETGCSQGLCCVTVCGIVSSCCEAGWDDYCVELALSLPSQCDLFVHFCPPGGAANDCAPNATIATFDVAYAFDLAGATADGTPLDGCGVGKDLWYLVQAPGEGDLSVDVAAPGVVVGLGVYEVPGPLFDPDALPEYALGCSDTDPSTGAVSSMLGIAGGSWRLIRLMAEPSTLGGGTITFRFSRAVFDTSITQPLLQVQSPGVYVVGTTGWSSGKLSAAQPQRWAAQAFTVPAAGGFAWRLTALHAYGFSSVGAVNSGLDYIVWKRSAFAKPLNGDQVATGSVPFPVPQDIKGGLPDQEPEDHLVPLNVLLAPGDYWLTVYASNTSISPANFVWLTNAPDGLGTPDGNGGVFMWRSEKFPLPGFLAYTVGSLIQAPGLDPLDLYNAGFRLLGRPEPMAADAITCPWDFDGNGLVDGADLGVLLAGWASPYAGSDLGQLLAAWGACPPMISIGSHDPALVAPGVTVTINGSHFPGDPADLGLALVAPTGEVIGLHTTQTVDSNGDGDFDQVVATCGALFGTETGHLLTLRAVAGDGFSFTIAGEPAAARALPTPTGMATSPTSSTADAAPPASPAAGRLAFATVEGDDAAPGAFDDDPAPDANDSCRAAASPAPVEAGTYALDVALTVRYVNAGAPAVERSLRYEVTLTFATDATPTLQEWLALAAGRLNALLTAAAAASAATAEPSEIAQAFAFFPTIEGLELRRTPGAPAGRHLGVLRGDDVRRVAWTLIAP